MVVSANLLPNGKQQFSDGNGRPYAGGSVYFYIPTTTTFKNTWSDPEKANLNTNPVLLDANGEAVIFGDGEYRQVLKDVNGNQIWDQISIQYVTVGGDLSGTLPNPSVNPSLFIDQFDTNKNPPVNADRFLALDSGNALAPIYFLWSQLVTSLATALQPSLDTRYAVNAGVGPAVVGLVVRTLSLTTLNISAAAVTLYNSANVPIVARNVSLNANIATTGANGLDTGSLAASTWYHLYIIYNSNTTTFAALISASPTTGGITLPTGYTYSAYVGAVRSDASSHLWGLLQAGNRAQIIIPTNPAHLPIMISGASGNPSTPTWTAVPVANFVPPTAVRILGVLGMTQDDNAGAQIAPNNAYGAWDSDTNGAPLGTNNTGITGSHILTNTQFDFVLESANIYYASNSTTFGAGPACYVMGWVFNF